MFKLDWSLQLKYTTYYWVTFALIEDKKNWIKSMIGKKFDTIPKTAKWLFKIYKHIQYDVEFDHIL